MRVEQRDPSYSSPHLPQWGVQPFHCLASNSFVNLKLGGLKGIFSLGYKKRDETGAQCLLSSSPFWRKRINVLVVFLFNYYASEINVKEHENMALVCDNQDSQVDCHDLRGKNRLPSYSLRKLRPLSSCAAPRIKSVIIAIISTLLRFIIETSVCDTRFLSIKIISN